MCKIVKYMMIKGLISCWIIITTEFHSYIVYSFIHLRPQNTLLHKTMSQCGANPLHKIYNFSCFPCPQIVTSIKAKISKKSFNAPKQIIARCLLGQLQSKLKQNSKSQTHLVSERYLPLSQCSKKTNERLCNGAEHESVWAAVTGHKNGNVFYPNKLRCAVKIGGMMTACGGIWTPPWAPTPLLFKTLCT